MNPATASRASYVWGLPAILMVLVPAAALRLPMPEWTGGLLLSATIWLLLVGLAETSPIALARRGSRARVTALFDFGALLCFSMVPAVVIAALGRVGAAWLTGRPMRATLRESAEAMLTIAVTGAVFFERGGTAGIAARPGAIPFAPAVVAMGVFALVSAGLAAWRGAALRERAGLTPPIAAHDQLLGCVVALPFGVAFAWLESVAGPVAGLSALVLVLLSRTLEHAAPAVAVAPASLPPRRTTGPDPQLETVRFLMSAIDAFDPFTRGHSARIALASVRVAQQLGATPEEITQIEFAALLHDIGRTAIHLDITRPGTLSGVEREVLHTHPTVGADIVGRIPGLEEAAEIVLAHHEQPDGRGYPRGLKGDAIPVGARIIMVAAAFDAMTRERPYRRGLAASAAYEELRRHAGSQFFPEVVEAYVRLHAAGSLEGRLDGIVAVPTASASGADEGLRAA